MSKIFISYGSDLFKDTLNRIGCEAKRLGIFDKIILYTTDNLPSQIKSSPLMLFKKGGGYWVWKPFIIWETLQRCNDDDIVIYADAGSCIRMSNEWSFYFYEINHYNSILFNYRDDFDYGWGKQYNCSSPKIKYWTKKNTLTYFDNLFNNKKWRENNKIWAGFIICKGRNNQLINEWLTLTLMHPELIVDPFGNEIVNQEEYYVNHRHDQSILTPLTYFYSQKGEVLILPETSESQKDRAAISAQRLRLVNKKGRLKTKMINIIKTTIGQKLYSILHFYR